MFSRCRIRRSSPTLPRSAYRATREAIFEKILEPHGTRRCQRYA